MIDLTLFFATAVAAFSGAIAAFIVDYSVRRAADLRYQRAIINNIILELAGRRALVSGSESPRMVKGAGLTDDYKYLVLSIKSVRSSIRESRAQLVASSKYLPPLRVMESACNSFLEQVQRDASGYIVFVRELRFNLLECVNDFHLIDVKNIFSDEPGSSAYLIK